MPTWLASSHALRGDRELEPLDAVGQRVGRSARDVVLEAIDLLDLGDQEVDLLGGLRGSADIDLLIVDRHALDIEGDLVLARDARADIEQEEIGRANV